MPGGDESRRGQSEVDNVLIMEKGDGLERKVAVYEAKRAREVDESSARSDKQRKGTTHADEIFRCLCSIDD